MATTPHIPPAQPKPTPPTLPKSQTPDKPGEGFWIDPLTGSTGTGEKPAK